MPNKYNIKPHERRWILVALMTTMTLAAMDATIVSTAIPQIVGDLGGFSLFSWVFSIYLLTQTVTIPIYGKLADLFGRKPILLFGISLFMLGSGLSALSWNMVSLIVFRGIQGLGAGAVMATVNTLAGDLYSVRERARIQGYFSSVWGMAAIIGPTIGGAFADYAHWRWIFLINIPIGFIAIFLIGRFLKEDFVKKVHTIDYPGAIMILLAGTTVIFTLTQGGQSWPWFSPVGIGMLVLSAVLILITVYVEKRSPEPMIPGWIWRNKILVGCNLAVIGMGIMMIGPEMYIPIYGQSVMGLGAIAAGLVLAAMSIGWPISSSLSGHLYLRIGFRNTSLIGTVLIMISCLGFWLMPYETSVWQIVADMVLLGAGFGLISTPTMVGLQSVVPWEKRGVVTGSNMFGRYLGQSLGAALLGGVFNAYMRDQIQKAPDDVQSVLPSVNDVIETLQTGAGGESVGNFLRDAFFNGSNLVFLTMGIFAVITFAVLWILPRHYPVLENEHPKE